MVRQQSLLGDTATLDGFGYRPGFIDDEEEAALLVHIRALEFHDMKMRGVTARRRVIQYGWNYSFENSRMTRGAPLPDFLLPLRERAAAFAKVESPDLSEALLMEYSPGAAIGWHRDAHPFGVVVGVSLLSASRFRFRRGQVRAWETTEVPLEPRSVYVLTGAARDEWEHSIPAVKELRYSITFRTLRKPAVRSGPRN